jgi:hypothetical protein
MPLSLALSKSEELTEAIALSEQVIEELVALGSTGLLLGSAYETRARIARDAGSAADFTRHAALCTQYWPAGERRLLGAKYQRQTGSEPDGGLLEELSMLSMFSSIVEKCHSPTERAHSCLDFLVLQSGASAGILYAHGEKGLRRAATVGEVAEDPALDAWAAAYFKNELSETDETAGNSGPPPAPETDEQDDRHEPGGSRFVRVLLSHRAERGVGTTGMALLVIHDEANFVYPSRLAAALSLTLAEDEDVETLYAS